MLMRGIQNAIAIIATFFVAGSLLPWSASFRITCVAIAFTLIVVLLLLRLRGHGRERAKTAGSAERDRIERIREERRNRYTR